MSSGFEEAFERRENELSRTREEKRRQQRIVDEVSVKQDRYLFRLGRQPVHLSLIEFRIIEFLSKKPYRAFARHEIVSKVSTDAFPVTEETLDEHIRTLRGKLGIFSDYIQTVPYIGYRFKP